jgi:hypothetical protein
VLVGSVKSYVSLIATLIKELDGSWVAVVVNLSPITHDRLHALEDFTLEVNLL